MRAPSFRAIVKPLGLKRSGWNVGWAHQKTGWLWKPSKKSAVAHAAAMCRSRAGCGDPAKLEVWDHNGEVVLERFYRLVLP